jgi:enamine deaminase RidA (YjgF/YER057c/UK114 family)
VGELVFCSGQTPARTTITVKYNPLDALVEIECIAEMPEKK